MKKISFFIILILIAFVLCSQVFAQVVTTRKLNQSKSQQRQQTSGYSKSKGGISSRKGVSKSTLEHSLVNCIPYSENQTFDVGGVNIAFSVNIAGWKNNKCQMDFSSNMDSIASTFSAIYGFEASEAAEISAFTPKIRCEFTKQQLAEFGDSILQEEERRVGATNNMLKNPLDVPIVSPSQMSANDQKLFDMLMNSSTCQMQGAEDINNVINSIFGL